MKLIISVLFLVLYSSNQSNIFKINGSYKVVFDSRYNKNNSSNYIITFRDSTYTKEMKNGKKIVGKITRVAKFDSSSSTIYLIDTEKYIFKSPLDSSLHNSFGNIIMEFKESKKDTLNFRTTYNANLHTTIDTGRLIKVK